MPPSSASTDDLRPAIDALRRRRRAEARPERERCDLGQAIAEHQALVRERKAREADRLGLDWLGGRGRERV